MLISSYSTTHSSYQQSTAGISKYLEQLSSGKKINSAADNPAYLVILQGMEGQENGYQQAYRNVQDTTSLLNVSEGAMNDSVNVVGDMQGLSIEAANGTLTDEDRSYIQIQMNQLASQVNYNANSTNFNGINTNNGSLTNFVAQVGANSGQTMSFSIGDLSSDALGYNINVSSQANAEYSISTLDSARQKISSSQSQVGALTNSLEYTGDNLVEADSNIQAAESRMGDTDMAAAISNLNSEKIKQYASIYAMKQNMAMMGSNISLLV